MGRRLLVPGSNEAVWQQSNGQDYLPDVGALEADKIILIDGLRALPA
ncbi:hypothetical protein [Klebsiella pneumoniae]